MERVCGPSLFDRDPSVLVSVESSCLIRQEIGSRGAKNGLHPGTNEGGGEYVQNGAYYTLLQLRFLGKTLSLLQGKSHLGHGSLHIEQWIVTQGRSQSY